LSCGAWPYVRRRERARSRGSQGRSQTPNRKL
jgi:hypothetical protein